MVGNGSGHLRGWVGGHFVLQLCDLLRQFLQGLHDVGPLLRFHPSVLLQPVYQSLTGKEGRAKRESVKDMKGLG